MSRTAALVVAAIVLALGSYAWWRSTGDEAAIERRLQELASQVNESTSDGRGLAARAASLGAYFTEDAVIELGRGTAEIRGRATIMDMASRLQPRTSAFRLRLTDVGVTLAAGAESAAVVLTAEFIRRGGGDDSIDAREFSLDMKKEGAEWRVARAAAVEAFR